MMNGCKTPSQQPLEVAENGGATTMSGTHLTVMHDSKVDGCSRRDFVHLIVLRFLCMASSVMALSFMVTASEASTAILYGFKLPIDSHWSYSYSYEYLVGISAATAAHSLLQLLISGSRLLRRSPVFLSRNQAWLIFAVDQMFAYAMVSAGSAASGVTNLNRTGIKHAPLPNFCKPLRSFCNHVAISIAFAFFGSFLLAASAVKDVIWLIKH
ncbi:DUF588 domain-containing protein [Cephalotus follicularis]|uniref:CASP-like protein n=1 Tax=Cephalotus follicularis TaxID=3775 RepID=A0A1Q3CBE2_CEPFO|nr:DUF588 domain-containing protein [Cephalotus follicularis]